MQMYIVGKKEDNHARMLKLPVKITYENHYMCLPHFHNTLLKKKFILSPYL